ncbi:MAG: hypothetical protein H6832_00355 [Planctomycetes bacterium]|nr:hypothetical protein [Planctomycetota bacterium]MCB9916834.1 hypothetical protein [Planctomycetota bacterium]
MDAFLRWLAGLGNEELPPGESLHFEFLQVPRGGFGLLVLTGFVAVLALVVLIYRRDAKRLSRGRRTTLAFLRLLALAFVALMLLEPSIVKVRKAIRPGEVLLLLDTSQSMSHKDSYRRSETEAAAWRGIGVSDPAELPRIDLAKALLAQDGLIKELAARNRLRPYVFGGGIRDMPVVELEPKTGTAPEGPAPSNDENFSGETGSDAGTRTGALPPPPVLDPDRIEAAEGSTNLSASVRQALERSRDARVAAVIVMTDGRRNAGSSVEELGAYLARRKVGETVIVPIGDPAETWTVGIREVTMAERVFKGDPLRVSAIVVSQGYELQPIVATLAEVDAEGNVLRELGSETTTVGGEATAAQFEFKEVTLESEGEHFLSVRIEPPPGEAFEARHQRTHRVEVLGEKLRVLLLAGAPTPEYRILRNQLIRYNEIDVSCWLQSADTDFPQDGNTVIEELPKDAKELDEFDAIIALDPDPQLVEPAFVSFVARAIQERGLGLWWVMGEKFSLRAVQAGSPLTPWIELLPIEPDVGLAEKNIGIGLVHPTQYPWLLTTEGKGHRVTSLAPDPVVNETLWSKLPGFFWSFPVTRAKPAAQVLVRHPDDRVRGEDGGRPMLALQFVGAGRVLYTGTDEFYRWRGVAEKAYDEIWVKGLRWLYEGKLTGGSSRYRLGISNDRTTLGQELEIYLRALDASFEPVSAAMSRVRITGPGATTVDVDLPRAPVGEGRFQGSFRPTAIGIWSVQAISDEGAGTEPVGRALRFEVLPSELESKGKADIAELDRFAEAAGGSVIAPTELADRARALKSFSTEETFTLPFPLWDGWFTLVLILIVLTLEWILRKRWNLV